jgi:penicillin-binding protein 2
MVDTESKQVRLSAVGIVAISLFLALFVRLWFLQGIDRQEFEAASVSNRLRVIHEEAPRGRILDRNGKVLVDNRTSIVVALDREPLRKMEPEERTDMFVDLADTLVSFGVPAKLSDLEKAYDDKRYAPQAYVPVAEDVSTDVEIYLAERADRFPGVVVERKAVRVYPYGTTAVHLLGYVGEINEEELVVRGGTVPGTEGATTTTVAPDEQVEVPEGKEYELGDSIGKTGVERSFESDLRGVPGKRTIEVNAQGDLVDVVSLDPPEAGDDIWLTIDVDLQAHAERLLEAKIQSLRGQLVTDRIGNVARGVVRLNAPQGSVVIQNPSNGEIMAMASYPDYDPTTVVNGISQDLWTVLNDPNSGQPLVNWALQGTYAPGSTFKLFTAVAAQRTGLLPGGDEVVNDPGFYNVENCTGETCEVQNAGRTPHGAVNLAESMTVSSDVYYYRIADKFWNRRGEFGETPIQDVAGEFGLGERTGIDLPGENRGRLPTPQQRKEAYEARPDLFMTGDWKSGDNINMSIGQGDVLATPLQLADSYSAFANGGTRYKPQVVTRVTRTIDPTKPPGELGNYDLVLQIDPEVTGTIAMDPAHYQKLWNGFLGVTQNAAGTAAAPFNASPTAWPMAGKTGTAQVNNKADTALFVGWGPAQPGTPASWTIAVVVPEAGFGGTVAAPLAFRILAPASKGEVPPACTVDDQAACDAAAAAAQVASANDAVGVND